MNLAARSIVLIVFGGFGVVMFTVGLRQHMQERRLLAAARPVPAVITLSQVRTSASADTDTRLLRDNSTTTHTAEVRFRYEVAGTVYESDMLYPCEILTSGSHESAAEALRPFPVGAEVTALVDDREPGKAFLIPRKSAAPTVFVLVGMLLPPIAYLAGKLI